MDGEAVSEGVRVDPLKAYAIPIPLHDVVHLYARGQKWTGHPDFTHENVLGD